MPCPDANVFAEFADGHLSESGLAKLDEHMRECSSCRSRAAASLTEMHSSASAPEAPMRDVPIRRGSVVGRYVITGVRGAGAMGIVYVAYDPELDRKVALKLMRRSSAVNSSVGRQRLQAEARAMAKLSHPNVVAVHDVGEIDDQAFVAMELVDGVSLREWLQKRRSWPEIRDTFIAAGRGLAAAHSAGLTHRDFKPENVLVGLDGQTRVTDFGLAQAHAPAPQEEGAAEGGDPEGNGGSSGDSTGDGRSTGACLGRLDPNRESPPCGGALVGTIAYMAPEQLRGEQAGPAADQFSFCVALYEACFGVRPFSGDSFEELRRTCGVGPVRIPARPRLPANARRAILRGLAHDPCDRFDSLNDLLGALAGPSRRRVSAWVAASSMLLAALTAALIAWWVQRPPPCSDAGAALVREWRRQRSTIQAAFEASGLPFASGSFARVDAVLADYAAAFSDSFQAACEAERAENRRPFSLAALRVECLDESREQWLALVRVFEHADARVIENAGEAASKLAPLERCADSELRSAMPLPRDLALRERVTAVRRELATAKALGDSGRLQEALAAAEQGWTEAEAVDFPPLRSEALFALARAQTETNAQSSSTVLAAALAAEAAGSLRVKADSYARLAKLEITERHDLERAAFWARFAEATVEALGSPSDLVAGVAEIKAAIAIESARPTEAEAQARIAVAAAELAHDPAYRAKVVLGNALLIQDRIDDALALFRESLAELEAELGPFHPRLVPYLGSVANALMVRGEYREARRFFQRALDLAPGESDSPERLRLSIGLAQVTMELAEPGEAVRLLEGVIFALRHKAEPDPIELANGLSEYGQALIAAGRAEDALRVLHEAIALREQKVGPDDSALSPALLSVGKILLGRGDAAAAMAPLQRAVELWRASDTLPLHAAEGEFYLGRALYESGKDRRRGQELVRQARATLAASPVAAALVAEIDSWTASVRR